MGYPTYEPPAQPGLPSDDTHLRVEALKASALWHSSDSGARYSDEVITTADSFLRFLKGEERR